MNVEEAFDVIRNGFDVGRVAHAYLLIGAPRGEAGALADRILQLLYCKSEVKPCGTCHGCRAAAAHTHPDIYLVEPEKKSRIISVEQVRDMLRSVYQSSLSGDWKTCLIVGADCMNAASANAFLKTLEEPPPRNLILMLTDRPQAILPTIRSRCQRVSLVAEGAGLDPEWRDHVLPVLSDSGGEGALSALARADGIEKLLKALKEAAIDDEAGKAETAGRDVDAETVDARGSARYRELRTAVLRTVLSWYRDVLMLVSGASEDVIVNQDHLNLLRKVAAGMSYSAALKNVQAVETMRARMDGNVREGTALADGFLGCEF